MAFIKKAALVVSSKVYCCEEASAYDDLIIYDEKLKAENEKLKKQFEIARGVLDTIFRYGDSMMCKKEARDAMKQINDIEQLKA